jgi:hypothetical protein
MLVVMRLQKLMTYEFLLDADLREYNDRAGGIATGVAMTTELETIAFLYQKETGEAVETVGEAKPQYLPIV